MVREDEWRYVHVCTVQREKTFLALTATHHDARGRDRDDTRARKLRAEES